MLTDSVRFLGPSLSWKSQEETMNFFRAVIRFLGNLLGPGPELSDQVRNYCRQEGVDPWALLEQNRESKPPLATGLQHQEAVGSQELGHPSSVDCPVVCHAGQRQ